MSYKRIETDNPILDEIVYNCKLILTSIIPKDESKANKLETKESLFNFDTYHAIMCGTIDMYYFSITVKDLEDCFPDEKSSVLNQYLIDIHIMPPDMYKLLLDHMVTKFLSTYEEMNDYYRLIAGMPPYDGSQLIYLKKRDVIDLGIDIDISKPIHKFSSTEKDMIISSGILDKLKAKYPDYEYLKYYDKKIDPYAARLSPKYDILYMDPNVNNTIAVRYMELYAINRKYIGATMDYDVYKYYSPLYERFVMIQIALSSMTDMIVSFNEFFINREIFDMRTAQYFFEAYGVDFYEEIPLRYQKRMIRALNKLIKYKSTDKNIYDIAQIFGFENIEIFKYYLHKKTGQYNDTSHYIIDPDTGNKLHPPVYRDDASKYELYFIKVPFKEMVNDYLKDDSARLNYESVTLADPYWNGNLSNDEVMGTILKEDFNTIKTKYISLNTVYDIADSSFQISYFMNMLLYYGINPSNMIITIPGIDAKDDKFNLFEAVVFIQALTYMYVGIDFGAKEAIFDDEGNITGYGDYIHTIVTDPDQLEGVCGFDLYADITQISSDVLSAMEAYIESECNIDGTTTESFLAAVENGTYKNNKYGPYSTEYINITMNVIKKFKTFTKNAAPTVSQLVEAYKTNKEVYDFIVYNMNYAQDINTYKVYKKLYDSLMIININNELFKLDNGEVAKSYTKWIFEKNSRMANKLISIIDISTDQEQYRQQLYEVISVTCDSINTALNSELLDNVFYDLPTESADKVKEWMTKVIKFFMSYKLQILNTQSVNKLEPDMNRLKDRCYFNALYQFTEYNGAIDSCASIKSNMTISDNMRPSDAIEVNVFYERR